MLYNIGCYIDVCYIAKGRCYIAKVVYTMLYSTSRAQPGFQMSGRRRRPRCLTRPRTGRPGVGCSSGVPRARWCPFSGTTVMGLRPGPTRVFHGRAGWAEGFMRLVFFVQHEIADGLYNRRSRAEREIHYNGIEFRCGSEPGSRASA